MRFFFADDVVGSFVYYKHEMQIFTFMTETRNNLNSWSVLQSTIVRDGPCWEGSLALHCSIGSESVNLLAHTNVTRDPRRIAGSERTGPKPIVGHLECILLLYIQCFH